MTDVDDVSSLVDSEISAGNGVPPANWGPYVMHRQRDMPLFSGVPLILPAPVISELLVDVVRWYGE